MSSFLRRPHQIAQGFSLLEAIIALALLAGLVSAVYATAVGASAQRESVQRIREEIALEGAALEVLRAQNMTASPVGEYVVGGTRVKWRAEPIGAPRDGTNWPRGVGLHRFQRYSVEATASRDARVVGLRTTMIGWAKVREDPRLQL